MSSPFSSIGALPVDPGLVALVAGAALVALALASVGLVLAIMRGANRRLAQAAAINVENLKSGFREQLAERNERIRSLESELGEATRANADLRTHCAALEASMAEQARQNEQNLNRFLAARQQMTDEFKALAGEVLKTHSETFSRQNREQVDLLLKPLGEKIAEFQKGLMSDRAALIEQVRTLHTTSETVAQQADNLAKALKGNAQVQGAWGEMILTSVLERSGLRRGEHFRAQQGHSGEDGARLRTDVEVRLPNGDWIVIDSKVSLNAFETYVNATDEEVRARSLKAHLDSVRAHIRTLSGKEYHRHAESGLDFVLMFVPIESAFALALSADPGLIDFAVGQHVCLATPTTLMSALRTIYNLWQIENRQKNAEEIAARAGLLYDKVVGFLDSMDEIDRSIERTRKSFERARGQLSTGSGNLLRQIEMLKELGARTGKRIPDDWLEADSTAAPARLIAPIESEPAD